MIRNCIGNLDAQFDVGSCGRTMLTRGYCEYPLHFTPPLYLDEHIPQMAYLFTQNSTGGICGGDRLKYSFIVNAQAKLHITNTAATKLHRMEGEYAEGYIDYKIDDYACIEHIPEPIIPYRGTDYRQHSRIVMRNTSTFIATEILYPGRACRNEIFDYQYLKLSMDINCDGKQMCSDATIIEPNIYMPSYRGILGEYDYIASIYAVAPWCDACVLENELCDILSGLRNCMAAVGMLPYNIGVFIKLLNQTSIDTRINFNIALNEIRLRLLGAKLNNMRK